MFPDGSFLDSRGNGDSAEAAERKESTEEREKISSPERKEEAKEIKEDAKRKNTKKEAGMRKWISASLRLQVPAQMLGHLQLEKGGSGILVDGEPPRHLCQTLDLVSL